MCAKTGLPAEVGVARTFVWVPGWTWILILFGIFPFLIARYFSARRVTIELPATVEVDGMRRHTNVTTIWVCATAVVVLVYSLWQQLSAAYWLVGALFVGAFVYRAVQLYAHWVGGYLGCDARKNLRIDRGGPKAPSMDPRIPRSFHCERRAPPPN